MTKTEALVFFKHPDTNELTMGHLQSVGTYTAYIVQHIEGCVIDHIILKGDIIKLCSKTTAVRKLSNFELN